MRRIVKRRDLSLKGLHKEGAAIVRVPHWSVKPVSDHVTVGDGLIQTKKIELARMGSTRFLMCTPRCQSGNYAFFGAGAASSFGGGGTSFTAGVGAAGAALPQQLFGAEQQEVLAAQQVAAGLQQLTV